MASGSKAAFPRPTSSGGTYDAQTGMTLRDYYAGQALSAAVSGGGLAEIVAGRLAPEAIARHCWALADALIAAERDHK